MNQDELFDERNRALLNMDVDWAMKQIAEIYPGGISKEALVAGMHKARYECAELPDAPRLESGEWLRMRGLKMLDGGNILPSGQLPPGFKR